MDETKFRYALLPASIIDVLIFVFALVLTGANLIAFIIKNASYFMPVLSNLNKVNDESVGFFLIILLPCLLILGAVWLCILAVVEVAKLVNVVTTVVAMINKKPSSCIAPASASVVSSVVDVLAVIFATLWSLQSDKCLGIPFVIWVMLTVLCMLRLIAFGVIDTMIVTNAIKIIVRKKGAGLG